MKLYEIKNKQLRIMTYMICAPLLFLCYATALLMQITYEGLSEFFRDAIDTVKYDEVLSKKYVKGIVKYAINGKDKID